VIRLPASVQSYLTAVRNGALAQVFGRELRPQCCAYGSDPVGFAHGWRMAEAMQAGVQWTNEADWSLAGTRIHALEGLFGVEPESKGRSPSRA